MSRDVNNKYWDKELETMPREELEKKFSRHHVCSLEAA